jgi:hypothetical protein
MRDRYIRASKLRSFATVNAHGASSTAERCQKGCKDEGVGQRQGRWAVA